MGKAIWVTFRANEQLWYMNYILSISQGLIIKLIDKHKQPVLILLLRGLQWTSASICDDTGCELPNSLAGRMDTPKTWSHCNSSSQGDWKQTWELTSKTFSKTGTLSTEILLTVDLF